MSWLRLLGVLAVAILIGLMAGHHWAGPGDLVRAAAGDDSIRSRLLFEWRFPRVLAAAMVGALLGLSGGIFQGVFRNALAEPYLLGSAGGASLGATIALLVPLGLPQALTLPTLAFVGAWGSILLVLAVSRSAGAVDAAGLLLGGVATAAMLGAIRSFLMMALSDENISLQVVMSWMLGGIQTPRWSGVLFLAAVSALALLGTRPLARSLDLLGLGETAAAGFGVDVRRVVEVGVLAGAAIVAAAVSFGGLVAFVGLVAPHVARWFVGPLHRPLLPASAVVGAAFVTLADGIARSALPPAEIPLGLITAIAGGPFFIVLLARKLRS